MKKSIVKQAIAKRKDLSVLISHNLDSFETVGTITENEIDIETDETVLVEIFKEKDFDIFIVRVYESDKVFVCTDIQTAQMKATELAYEYLTD